MGGNNKTGAYAPAYVMPPRWGCFFTDAARHVLTRIIVSSSIPPAERERGHEKKDGGNEEDAGGIDEETIMHVRTQCLRPAMQNIGNMNFVETRHGTSLRFFGLRPAGGNCYKIDSKNYTKI